MECPGELGETHTTLHLCSGRRWALSAQAPFVPTLELSLPSSRRREEERGGGVEQRSWGFGTRIPNKEDKRRVTGGGGREGWVGEEVEVGDRDRERRGGGMG